MAAPFKLTPTPDRQVSTLAEGPALNVEGPRSRRARTGAEAGPANPLAEERPGDNVVKVTAAWTPMMGQNAARIRQQHNPYPPVESPRAPFKLKE